ncbi:glutamate synthase-related protein [Ketogulonicigenium vulgare]|uniref:Probable glutamate synthase large subunit n=1 Tax=Ketogulonicigenium vulgare (strain WSH-001) TaxID=759362 RepID=F9YBA5_KETVW|nr:glutamate synthase-related protein [Ketogulonicigenium vulgare]ADO44133.1 glutamate synthase large subunit [Ketogulonicigenium vulgare Y25]AEM42657.1 probable glutamate synthase large subunit [Ketogulonicigenium vulgare WSH-001]ALJ82462.1 GltA [Ketogulonicigenium vulgare]ANW35248.1 glutamate synthase large subunit [Ketogulonicigenium vulgare]AOZ53360.1 glutamate synthase large subunit [Ketogulonicigenium vulgare]
MNSSASPFGLYDPQLEHSHCGVGFLTRKDSVQTHDVLLKGHEALCAVPHRGGMSSEGVGDGAGISVDLSLQFFSRLTGVELTPGAFGVGNFFLPADHARAAAVIEGALRDEGLRSLTVRDLPVNLAALPPRAHAAQLPIRQWIFAAPDGVRGAALDTRIHRALLAIEAVAYTDPGLDGLYPLSLSARMQVLKGRLNSWEIVPYFSDLSDPDHAVHTLYFHTRFSTNTDPHPSMAQPFRLMAHNGELNTDKKNRLSEAAVALARNRAIQRPKGQSDSCRLDQTLNARVYDEGLDLVTAVVSMMPPAWENDEGMPADQRDMFAYFSLYEEKNDGPAALVFGDGNIIGARLDRLGLRPLRTIETAEYLAVMSEAGQIGFDPKTVLRRGRVEAGGMIYYDHARQRIYETEDALATLARARDYTALLADAQVNIDDLPEAGPDLPRPPYLGDLNRHARYVAYTHNQESFRFLMDPMLQSGAEKVTAMGYGNAINALSDNEGGVAKYFSQRFAQVTNPPLDSIREVDGMTMRVALGEKPWLGRSRSRQIVVNSPILRMSEMLKIKAQDDTPWGVFEMLYTPIFGDPRGNEAALTGAIDALAADVARFARDEGGIAILTDRHVSRLHAAMPMTLVVSAVNQRLIEEGLRLKVSLVIESGQISSSHHIACALGFGGAAVYPLGVRMRAEELFADKATAAFTKFHKAAEKALMKTMGKVGLCTVESYSGGEFFEPNFLDTNDPVFRRYLPNMKTAVGGVRFATVAQSVADWHERALSVAGADDVPMLGLFKERSEGAGHSYGATAVRGFVDLTEEPISFATPDAEIDPLRLLTLRQMDDAFGIDDAAYVNTSFDKITPAAINNFQITPGYRTFSRAMAEERHRRPAALRDVLAFPADISFLTTTADIKREMMLFNRAGNNHFTIRGVTCTALGDGRYTLHLTGPKAAQIGRLDALAQSLLERFAADITDHHIAGGMLHITCTGMAQDYLSRLRSAPDAIPLDQVEPAADITPRLASGAMSHGALVASAHEAVAHGTNMVGGMSNSGEGGEHISRYGTIRASRIKQFASGRFGVWAGYLADPNLQEIEIKIGQGAKPGEGGQLPAPKVTVEIAAARGGTPGVELISPPPHHDTYSIEDLGQLIHDAKAARVRVVVKLVSSEGIGTIAVGVAKAGADVINVAGNTGGTGAASVTSLKYTGRAAEIGIAEVHQALCANAIRQKVSLRCSGAMQTGSDVVKAALLGGDSFEFGTTALMMLKCVMAKNCNVKCPAGLTTNPEVFDGDPRALAQYLLNIAHEVREILANLGLSSLAEARGRADLLHLLDHPASVGQLNLRAMLTVVPEKRIKDPIYLERDYAVDDLLLDQMKAAFQRGDRQIVLRPNLPLGNRNKSVGGQLAIDIERMLNHQNADLPAFKDDRGRRYLDADALRIQTTGAAGQSFGAFCNDGMTMHHTGTCNDGVGKSACGGQIIIRAPEGGGKAHGENVLVGNFALFGATGGRCFIEGQAGDRFAVRNSGATAVVEGVGDFCAEYMTHGAVLNLGGFSKGFGNGMSGGFAYQYDPERKLAGAVSRDSVLTGHLDDGTPHGDIHGDAVRQLLEWHAAATGSARAQRLLSDWAQVRGDFAWVMPKALLQYQDADQILATKPRKDLVEELATALAAHQVAEVKRAWRQSRPVLRGAVPEYGQTDTETMFRLLNSYTVMTAAGALAHKRESNPLLRDKALRNLILTEDFALMMALAKHARAAIGDYDDAQLASLVAHKRLADFKRALSLRNILSMDSPGTYAWVMHQNAKNRAALGEIPSFDALFAKNSLPDTLAQTAAE